MLGAPGTPCVWCLERRIGGHGVNFSERRAPHGRLCERTRGEKGAAGLHGSVARAGIGRSGAQGIRAPTPPAVMYLVREQIQNERGKKRGRLDSELERVTERAVGCRYLQSLPAALCSPIPRFQPLLLQSICIFLFSNQSERIPSTLAPRCS